MHDDAATGMLDARLGVNVAPILPKAVVVVVLCHKSKCELSNPGKCGNAGLRPNSRKFSCTHVCANFAANLAALRERHVSEKCGQLGRVSFSKRGGDEVGKRFWLLSLF